MKGRLSTSTIALLVAPPLFWAGNAVTARALVGEFPPLALSLARWVLAFLLIAPFAARPVWQHRAAIRRQFGYFAVIGLLGVGCYNSLQYVALQTSTAVNATLIGASAPVLTSLMGAAFFATPIGRAQWIGALLSTVGVIVVIARGDPVNLLTLQFASGDLIMLVATATWALYTWLLRTRRTGLPLGASLTVQIGLGALMILPFALIEYAITDRTAAPTPSNLAALAYIALLPSLAAYYCWDRGVERAGAVLPMLFVNLTPMFAALLAWIFLSEPIGIDHLIGGALIIAGIAVASRSPRTRAA